MGVLTDVAAERAVLGGLCQNGYLEWLNVGNLLNIDCFTVSINQSIFKCIHHLFSQENCKINSIDMPTLQSAAQDVQVSIIFSKPTDVVHINSVLSTNVKKDNIGRFAKKIRKLFIIRDLERKLKETGSSLHELTGDEPISAIINIAEDAIFSFTESLDKDNNGFEKIGDGLYDLIKERCENPVEQLGISTGYPIYDKSIGGGLITGVHLTCARMKVGKTIHGMNIGYNIARQQIPVLYCDSEMEKNQFKFRSSGMASGVEIEKIATGKIAKLVKEKNQVRAAVKELESLPFYWESINGMPFEQQLALIRKWIIQKVGLLPDGRAKKCVIIYDYIKLNDAGDLKGDLKEHQILGFMTNSLHNICVKYDVPIKCYAQLSRTGIDSEGTDAVGGSDRIGMAVSSLSFFKVKSDEEIATDGPNEGNRKMVHLFSRNGGDLGDREYINFHMKGYNGRLTEGRTNFEIKNGLGGPESNGGGFIVDNDEEEKKFD